MGAVSLPLGAHGLVGKAGVRQGRKHMLRKLREGRPHSQWGQTKEDILEEGHLPWRLKTWKGVLVMVMGGRGKRVVEKTGTDMWRRAGACSLASAGACPSAQEGKRSFSPPILLPSHFPTSSLFPTFLLLSAQSTCCRD